MSPIVKFAALGAARIKTLALNLALGLALVSGAAIAQPRPGDAPPDGRNGPPAEALAACRTLKSSDTCRFTDARGTTSGACWAPQGKPLACRPADAPAPGASAPQQAPKK